MIKKLRFLNKLNKNNKERGASLVEYGLLVALIAAIGIPAIRSVGNELSSTMAEASAALGAATIPPPPCTPANPSFPLC